MDNWQAQYEFWNSFGIPAYEETSVPKGAAYPYITYQAVDGVFGAVLPVNASIWTRTTSWTQADTKANEIKEFIKTMGYPKIEGGRYRVFINSDSMWAQSMNDPNDDQIKRKRLDVRFEFMTS